MNRVPTHVCLPLLGFIILSALPAANATDAETRGPTALYPMATDKVGIHKLLEDNQAEVSDLGNGWIRGLWFGDLWISDTEPQPWIYVTRRGWFHLATPSAVTEDIWIYKPELGWLWTDQPIFPWAYSVNKEAFINLNDSIDPPPPHLANYTSLTVPESGDHTLNILSPNLLELVLINNKLPDSEMVDSWNWVDEQYQLTPPDMSRIDVTVNGEKVNVTDVGFKRRPLYVPDEVTGLRISNHLYLQLDDSIEEHQPVEVVNDGMLWSTNKNFSATAHPLRFNPAIHVNQEGYVTDFPKIATVGYYLGDLGEMVMPLNAGFQIVDAATRNPVYEGSLTLRLDFGYTYTPTPYQSVYEADFSSFTPPAGKGEYHLVVPGMGASLPFRIEDGIAMAFARTYALGLYHQRSGTPNEIPYTRFTHGGGHTNPAQVPRHSFAPYDKTWNRIARSASQESSYDPPQPAPVLTLPNEQLYPFINLGPVDVSGGYFEAGNYSKVTWNNAQLVHNLIYAVDMFPGVVELDNLGMPESGDGISDILQAAKWETDFLAKMQDSDGGFYYAVHPINRAYEDNVLPDEGDPQVVWPKNTSATAAAVAALAQVASSPHFKAAYPQAAAIYMEKAELGWAFLMDAINEYGMEGSYQAIMHFGGQFEHDDDLAWAACEMFLATGDPKYEIALKSWFTDPSDPSTFRWGWWRMYASYGNVIRSYASAEQTGRLSNAQLDADYLNKATQVIIANGDDNLRWSQLNAYGTSFPDESKRLRGARWYISSVQAFELVTAYQFDPDPAYMDAVVRNWNYEAGNNPVNVTYVTGLGQKRQRIIVDQYSANDRRALPKTGIPISNIQEGFQGTSALVDQYTRLTYPSDVAATAPYPYYDRWGDHWNVTTESSTVDISRSLMVYAWLAAQTPVSSQSWSSSFVTITEPENPVVVGAPVTVKLEIEESDLQGIKIIWEAHDQEPVFGDVNTLDYTFTPTENAPYWIEAEVIWPDGRRAYAVTSINVGG